MLPQREAPESEFQGYVQLTYVKLKRLLLNFDEMGTAAVALTPSGRRDRRGDRLDVLATLIDAHGAEHYRMELLDPIEAIKFRMDRKGLSRRKHRHTDSHRRGSQSRTQPIDCP